VFAVIVIFAGLFLGFYVLIIFGFVLLVPALLVPSPKPPQRPAEQKKEQPRRPSLPPEPIGVPTSPAPVMTAPTPYVPMSAQPSASSPLFPTALFPPLSLPLPQAKPPLEAKQVQPESRDEVLEYGLLLAILMMVAG
jgi:hypothetical protein